MRKIYRWIKHNINSHIITPSLRSVSPINEVSWGMAIGMWIGLTPTVGIQMYVVLIVWLFSRYILKFRFDLVVASAIVWITNPLTMGFIYYSYLITGNAVFNWLGFPWPDIDYLSFKTNFSEIIDNSEFTTFQRIIIISKYLLHDFGIPIFIGSLFYATFFSILSFHLTKYYLLKYRKKLAQNLGMNYADWKKKFESASKP